MTVTLHIREYRSEDAEPVSRLIRATMRVSNAQEYPSEVLEPLIDYFCPAKVDQLGRERYCLVAEDTGSIVGTAALEDSMLVTFFVHPTRQREGIGSALLEALERSAFASGLRELFVEASVTGASFYERNGYRRTGMEVERRAGPQIELRKEMTD